MRTALEKLLKSKAINGWGLYFLISVPISLAIFITMMGTDMSTGESAANMISYSVRFAIPLIFLVVGASSFQILFPSPFGKWWLRNRKYIGMCFATAMAWQGIFIFWVSTFLREYYFSRVYLLRDEMEGTVGYLFLSAMVLTSFHFGRKYVSPLQWKLIQKGGVYFLWSYAFAVYWWNLFYYPQYEPFPDPRVIDYIYYWAGFTAFGLRIAAWGKIRLKKAKKISPLSQTPTLLRALGIGIIAIGLVGSATALTWYKPVYAFTTGPAWSAELVLWLPFWPLTPFLPIFIIGLGTLLATTVLPQTEKAEMAN